MKNSLETRLGLFFALALLALIIVFELIGGFGALRPGLPVRARFDTVQELKVGDPVKMAGVAIGRVDGIELVDNKVEVRMKLTSPALVRTDSKAAVRFVGLLGQNYIAIEFGTSAAPAVTADTVLETLEQADLNSLMVKLESVAGGVENLTKSFTGDSINNLLGPMTDFIRENRPRLSAILSNAETISAQVARGEGTVGKLIMEDELYVSALSTVTNLNAVRDDLKLALDDARQTLAGARSVVDSVNADQGTFGRLLKDETLYTETTTAMTNLREIMQKINRGEGSVGKLVNDEALYRNAKLTLQKLEKTTESLEDQGPLSILGIAVGSLF